MKNKTRKPSPTESPLLIEIDPEPIPETLTAMGGVPLVNRALVQELGRRCLELESRKQEALRRYEGQRGYQPMPAVWAEMNVVLADEFRDGHESGLINWLRDEKRGEGPPGFIGFAISARMSEAWHKAMKKMAEQAWEP